MPHRSHRKGSIGVFLVMILGAMVLLAYAVHEAAVRSAARSAGEGTMVLATRSVLSEYDQALFGRYGLLAFRGSPPEISESLMHYAATTLDSTPYSGCMNFGRPQGVIVWLSRMRSKTRSCPGRPSRWRS